MENVLARSDSSWLLAMGKGWRYGSGPTHWFK
jgi:hypothetical protein